MKFTVLLLSLSLLISVGASAGQALCGGGGYQSR
jgi:hypothetical protein